MRLPLLTLDHYLGLVSADLHTALVSPEYLARIRSVARQMPAFSMVGFEAELGTDVPAVDFAVAVRTGSGDREILARWLNPSRSYAAQASDPRWERIGAFVEAWADPASLLYEHIHSVWLEYDMQEQADRVHADEDSDGATVPSGCFTGPEQGEQPVVPNILFGMNPAKTSREVAWTVTAAALRVLYGEVPTSLIGHLNVCFAALQPNDYILQVGVMLARRLRVVRVCVSRSEPRQIPEYLVRIGREEEGRPVADILRSVAQFYHTAALDIDIADRILPRIGLELYPDRQRRPWLDPVWRRLLDHLTERGQCTAAKRDALLHWPGHSRAQLLWTSTILRGLNHLKLTYMPGRAPAAKAYFGLVHTPVSPA